jgi:hypothetical protein
MSRGGLLISGALVIQLVSSANAVSTLPRERGRDAAAGMSGLGTLLGPEGADVFLSVSLGWTSFSPNGPGHALGACAGVRGGLGAGTDRILRTA